jgi:MFS family permease
MFLVTAIREIWKSCCWWAIWIRMAHSCCTSSRLKPTFFSWISPWPGKMCYDRTVKRESHPALFYGWVIVVASFATLSVAYIVRYTFSVFFVAILEEYGWSRALTAGVFSLGSIVYGCASPVFGTLADRYGARAVVRGGAVALAIGLIGSSLISEPWQYYLCFGLLASAGNSAAGYVPNATLMANWFRRRLGLVLGTISAGTAFGILFAVPLAQYLIDMIGWRHAYVAFACLALGVVLTASLFMIRHPQERGLLPDGGRLSAEEDARRRALERERQIVNRDWARRNWTLGGAARTYQFWLIMAAGWSVNFATQIAFAHQVALLVDAGYEKMLAAVSVSMIGFAGMVGKMGLGAASDRWGREWVFSAGLVSGIIGLVLLMAARTVVLPWLPYACGLWIGVGYAATGILPPTLSSDLFHGKSFGLIFGVMNMAGNIGGAVGAWSAGYLFDLSRDYLVPVLLAQLAMAVAVGCIWGIAPRKIRLVPGKART